MKNPRAPTKNPSFLGMKKGKALGVGALGVPLVRLIYYTGLLGVLPIYRLPTESKSLDERNIERNIEP